MFRHLPEYLEGRTPKKNVLSFFKKNFTHAKSEMQGVFFLSGFPPSPRGGSGGMLRAYNSVSSHHARGACISPFQDFFQNAFGFRRTEGAKKLDTNSDFDDERVRSAPAPPSLFRRISYFALRNAPPKKMLPLPQPSRARATRRNSLFVVQATEHS